MRATSSQKRRLDDDPCPSQLPNPPKRPPSLPPPARLQLLKNRPQLRRETSEARQSPLTWKRQMRRKIGHRVEAGLQADHQVGPRALVPRGAPRRHVAFPRLRNLRRHPKLYQLLFHLRTQPLQIHRLQLHPNQPRRVRVSLPVQQSPLVQRPLRSQSPLPRQ